MNTQKEHQRHIYEVDADLMTETELTELARHLTRQKNILGDLLYAKQRILQLRRENEHSIATIYSNIVDSYADHVFS